MNTREITNIYAGSTQGSRMYLGDELVWPIGLHPDTGDTPDTGSTGYTPVTTITVNVPSVITDSGQAIAVVNPGDADANIVWSSSDNTVATIDSDGNITVISDGQVTICATDTLSGLQDCETITVIKTPEPGPDTGDTGTTDGRLAITYRTTKYNQTVKISENSRTLFLEAEVDDGSHINTTSNYYTGRYTFTTPGLHTIYYMISGGVIQTRAFQYCPNLTDVFIPEGITTIGVECFSNCTALTAVTLSNTVTTIGTQAFMNCSGLTEFVLTSVITTIDGEAFRNCYGLSGITIPSSVSQFGAEVFENCSGMTEMIFEGTTPPIPTGSLSLGNLEYTFPIYVPDSSVTVYQSVYTNYASRITGISNRS